LPIPLSSVSFSQLRDEVRAGTGSPTTIPGAIPLNNAQIRTYCFNPGLIPTTTSRSLSQAQGVSFIQFTIAAPTTTYNLRSAMVAAGWPGADRGIANVNISSGVTLSSAGISQAAFGQGSTPWPAPSSAEINMAASSRMVGKGGAGGDGGDVGGVGIPTAQWTAGDAGQGGGKGMDVVITTVIIGPPTSQIVGGGGGGGGGNARRVPAPASSGGGGGGGGGVGTGGSGGGGGQGGVVVPGPPYPAGTVAQPGQNGAAGTSSGGGTGGQNTPQPAPTRAGIGGNGGAAGAAGQAGSSGAATPGTQGPGFGAAGAAGPSINGYSLVTLGSTVTTGPLVP